MNYKSIITDIKEILRFKLQYCMYIINAVSLIRTFHLSEQNFEPMNQRGSDKQGCTVMPCCYEVCVVAVGVVRAGAHTPCLL